MFIGSVICSSCRDDDKPAVVDKKLNAGGKLITFGIVADAAISITALVVGILGLLGVIHGIPPAACYGLFAVSGVITLIWAVLSIGTKGKLLKAVAGLLQAAVSCDPKPYKWDS